MLPDDSSPMSSTVAAGAPARICAWCQHVVQEGAASHGICASCESAWTMSARKMRKPEWAGDRMALYVVQSGSGWELRSGPERGIIFSTYRAAIELARTWMEDGHPVLVPTTATA